MEFKGKTVKLPWNNWDLCEVSPEGLHTSKGIFRPSQIELLLWKANQYDKGKTKIPTF
jgi:hypothetical protein